MRLLTDEEVRDIRERVVANGEKQTVVAESIGVYQSVVSLAVNNVNYKHVGGPIKQHEPRRKLNNAKAKQIRERIASGEKQCALAAEYGVSSVTITNVKWVRCYKTAGGPIPNAQYNRTS